MPCWVAIILLSRWVLSGYRITGVGVCTYMYYICECVHIYNMYVCMYMNIYIQSVYQYVSMCLAYVFILLGLIWAC